MGLLCCIRGSKGRDGKVVATDDGPWDFGRLGCVGILVVLLRAEIILESGKRRNFEPAPV